MTLAAMLTDLPAGSMAYAAAADREQGRLIIDSIRGFVTATPGLASAVDVQAFRVLVPDRGVMLEVLAADAASAWGLRPAWLTVDELTGWPTSAGARMFYDALTSALPKIPGSRSVTISTAGSPGHWSFPLYKAALADSVRWRVSERHEPAPWIDRAEVEGERARLMPSMFARLWENRWVSGEDRLVSPEDLDACTRDDALALEYQPGVQYVVSVDLGLVNDRTVAVVAHREGERVVVDRVAVWQGRRGAAVELATVQAWLSEASAQYGRAAVVFDPFQAASMMQALRREGMSCREFAFTSTSVGKLGLTLYRLLREHRLSLPADPELREELLNVRLREGTPGVYRLDHDAGRHDDRAIAVALAAFDLVDGDKTPTIQGWLMPDSVEPVQDLEQRPAAEVWAAQMATEWLEATACEINPLNDLQSGWSW